MRSYENLRSVFIKDKISKYNIISHNVFKEIFADKKSQIKFFVEIKKEKRNFEQNLLKASILLEVFSSQKSTLLKIKKKKEGSKILVYFKIGMTLRSQHYINMLNYSINVLSLLKKRYQGLVYSYSKLKRSFFFIQTDNINFLIGIKYPIYNFNRKLTWQLIINENCLFYILNRHEKKIL